MSEQNPLQRFVLASGQFFFKYRNLLFTLVFAVLFIATGPDSLFGEGRVEHGLEILGVSLVVLGQGFRLLVIGYEYIKRGGKDGQVYADHLVTQGFFAHSRNPMYLGNILIVCGICLVHQSLMSFAVIIPFFFFAYYSIVVAEENYLSRKFGPEYDTYCRTVNRFIPNFKGLSKSLSGYEYDWKRALRKDYGNVTVAALALWFNAAQEHWDQWSLDRSAYLFRVIPSLTAVAVFYAVARFLKKTHRLASPN